MKYLFLILAVVVLLACKPEPIQLICRVYEDAQGSRAESCSLKPYSLPDGWEKMSPVVVDILIDMLLGNEEDPYFAYDDEALVVSFHGDEGKRAVRAWLGRRGFSNKFQPGDPGIRARVPRRSIPDLARLEEVQHISLISSYQRFHPPAPPPRQDYAEWCLEPSPDCTPGDVLAGIARRGSGDPRKYDIRVVPHQGQKDSLVAWLESLGYRMQESAPGTPQEPFIVRTADPLFFEQLMERDEVDWLGGVESPEPVMVRGFR